MEKKLGDSAGRYLNNNSLNSNNSIGQKKIITATTTTSTNEGVKSFTEEVTPIVNRTSVQQMTSTVTSVVRNTNRFDARIELEKIYGGKVRSALEKGTVIHGKLNFDTPVQIDGTLGGGRNMQPNYNCW